MTVKEILKLENGNYTTYEVWAYTDHTHRLHTDFIENIDESHSFSDFKNTEVADYQLMNEYDYNNSINANSSISNNFEDLYDDKNAKILVIMLDQDWNAPKEELEPVTTEKMKMAECLISLPGWDGLKNAQELCELYTDEQLKDMLESYDMEFSDYEYENSDLELTKEQHDSISLCLAREKYDKANTQRFSLKLNKKTDAEIIKWLNKQPSKQGAIKAALELVMKGESN